MLFVVENGQNVCIVAETRKLYFEHFEVFFLYIFEIVVLNNVYHVCTHIFFLTKPTDSKLFELYQPMVFGKMRVFVDCAKVGSKSTFDLKKYM